MDGINSFLYHTPWRSWTSTLSQHELLLLERGSSSGVGKNSGAKRPCSVPVAAYVITFYDFGQGRVLKSFRLGRRVFIFGGAKQGFPPFETRTWWMGRWMHTLSVLLCWKNFSQSLEMAGKRLVHYYNSIPMIQTPRSSSISISHQCFFGWWGGGGRVAFFFCWWWWVLLKDKRSNAMVKFYFRR